MRAALLALLLLPPAGRPDLLTPGHKNVRHELVLLWDDTAAGQRFVASATRGFHGTHEIRRGEPFRFSTKYGTRIHAVPAATELPTDREQMRAAPWPNTVVPVREVRSIATGHPLHRIETTLRIVRVTAGGIEFERVGERRFDRHGNQLGDFEWLPLLLLAAIGAVWTWRLSRRPEVTTMAP